jgi:hypothetical protein
MSEKIMPDEKRRLPEIQGSTFLLHLFTLLLLLLRRRLFFYYRELRQ